MATATKRAPEPTCCCHSARRPGPICWRGQCWPSNCSGRPRSLRTTPIIAKDRGMGSRLAVLLAASPMLLAAASAPVAPEAVPIDVTLRQARAEVRAAETDLSRLEKAAKSARDEVARLAAERQAAAAAIAVSEARISAADAQAQPAEALVAERAARLARRQAPVAALLTGIVSMGRRPPLLSIADSASLDELVRLRLLLNTTLPVIRARSANLSAELAESRRLQQSA